MDLTPEEKEKIRESLERETEQNRNKYLSSLKSFEEWIRVVAGIAIAAKEITEVFLHFCSLFS